MRNQKVTFPRKCRRLLLLDQRWQGDLAAFRFGLQPAPVAYNPSIEAIRTLWVSLVPE
jgi:hypothetical protein